MKSGFIAAGLMNVLGVLFFSRGLTTNVLGEHYPEVFGRFGLIAIILWGLAYLAVSRAPRAIPVLSLVFALEKVVYVVTWVIWIITRGGDLATIWQQDPLAAIFFAIYGPNDLLFGLFFAWCGIRKSDTGKE